MVYAFFEWLLSRGVNPKLNGVSEWGTRRDEDACAHPLCGSVWSHQSKKAHWIRTHRVFPASPINSILALRAKIYYKVKPVCIERTSPLLGSDVDSSGEAFGIYILGQLDFWCIFRLPLTSMHRSRDKMTAVLQTAFSHFIPSQWLVDGQATDRYLSQRWTITCTNMCVIRHQWVK